MDGLRLANPLGGHNVQLEAAWTQRQGEALRGSADKEVSKVKGQESWDPIQRKLPCVLAFTAARRCHNFRSETSGATVATDLKAGRDSLGLTLSKAL